MIARVRKFLNTLRERFWLLPGVLVAAGILLAMLAVSIDRRGLVPDWLADSGWLYGGGATGARTLLGAVAASTIGVAGTVFSITIAALSLTAGQMGPRLLRNFTRDRGNQLTLGAFLGTFCYALTVLRSVRTPDEGDFVPPLALGIGLLLAFLCVATLVYFVGHLAGRINVETVIELVSEDLRLSLQRLTGRVPSGPRPAPPVDATPALVRDDRRGYLQELDAEGLADWAARAGTTLRLLVRPGGYVFPGAPVAALSGAVPGALEAVRDATALGPQRGGSADVEFAVRQLVEVAVRALSPGINDPHTAIGALDRLGAALCDIVPLQLPDGLHVRDGRTVLAVPVLDYGRLVDVMFHMIRQSACRSPAVLMRMLEVLAAVALCERQPERLASLRRHADLVLRDAEREVGNPSDLADLRRRHDRFLTAQARGAPQGGPA